MVFICIIYFLILNYGTFEQSYCLTCKQELCHRTVFFDKDANNQKAQYTDPTDSDFSKEEQFVISAFQGRQKMRGKKDWFYGTAYPTLARQSWLRYKDPITVNGFLFDGPISHYPYSFFAFLILKQ